MSISLSITGKGFREAERALAGIKNGYPRAAAKAINEGLVSGRKVAAREIGARYNLKAATIKEAMALKKANARSIEGWLETKGPMLPIALFSPSKPKRLGSRWKAITVKILRRGARKVVRGGFAAKGTILERRQPAREPVFRVSTIGIPYMIRQLGILKKVEEAVGRTTFQRLDHYVGLFLRAGKASFRVAPPGAK